MTLLDVQLDNTLADPHAGAQHDFFHDWSHRYCAFVGGLGSGKSWIGARKLITQHVYNAFTPDGQPTYCSSLMVAQSYQAARTFNMPQIDESLREANISFRFHSTMLLHAYELLDLGTKRNPVYIFVRSAEAGKAIAGFEIGSVWGDEVARWPSYPLSPTDDAYIQADFRARAKNARVYQFNMTYTNEGEDTQPYRDFEIEPKPDHALYRGSTDQNTSLPPGYVESLMGRLSPDLVEQYVRGGVATLGANNIYHNYNEKRNVQPIELVPGWPLQVAFDFNKTPGMHLEVGQYFPEKELLTTCHEIHKPGMLLKQAMQEFDDQFGHALRTRRYTELEVFGDATGSTGSTIDGTSYWDVVREELQVRKIPFRMRVPRSNPGQSDRANAVNSAFISASGRVRYIVNKRCERLRTDYRSMKWDVKNPSKMAKGNIQLSHPSDADGYRVSFLLPIYRPGKAA